jgi:membrane protein DedA with SNARE-associated domain
MGAVQAVGRASDTTSSAAATTPDGPPQWLGTAMSVSLLIGFGWQLGYTLGPLPGQGALGPWNYLVTGVCLVVFVTLGWVARQQRQRNQRTAARR